MAAGALMVFAWLGAVGQPGVADAACPNEERRAEQGAPALALPDCRAYELVSRGSTLYQDADGERASEAGSRAAPHGDALTYFTNLPAEDASTSGGFHLAVRGPSGWSTRNLAPQNNAGALLRDQCAQSLYFSRDLTRNIDEEGWFFDGYDPSLCRRSVKPLVPGESPLHRNVFLHDVATDSYRLLNLTPEGVEPANAKFQDASEDFGRILFSVEARLTPESLPGYNLYVWEDGEVRLATYLSNGTPVAGALAESTSYVLKDGITISGNGLAPLTGAFSEDGSRLFFYAGEGLHLRLNPTMPQSPITAGQCTEPELACTIQIDATQGPGASGGGNFWRASSDGSKVFFTAESKLTTDSTAASTRADLYEYEVETGELTDLTAGGGGPADVRGIVGSAEDGSHIYFVANGVLAPGASAGTCRGTSTTPKFCSLYLAHEGEISFVATLSRNDRDAWQEPGFGSSPTAAVNSISRIKQSRVRANVSPNGLYLAFNSIQGLTGYDNRDIATGTPNRMIFLYDALGNEGAGEIHCASCIPDGTRPDEHFEDFELADSYGPGGKAKWRNNSVLDDGSVFFDTRDGLLPEDTNGRRDVYRFKDGALRLLSTGTHASDARFYEATPSGSDVFIRTPQTFVGHDTDEGHVSLYDARVGGGFPEPLPLAPPCEGEGCRNAAALVSSLALPGTSTFIGPGNRRTRKSRKKQRSQRQCVKARRGKQARRCGKVKRASYRRAGRGTGLERRGLR